MLISLMVAVLLSFSYRILERLIGLWSPKQTRYTVYYWGILLMAASFFFQNNYIFHTPHHIIKALPVFLVVLAVNVVISRNSGYRPEGTFHRLNFMITYPVLEEIAFRGLVLPLLVQVPLLGESYQFLYVTEISLAVLLTAFLFAVSHLQYYRLNRQSMIFMAYAFSGGLFLGIIAQFTESILLTLPLHITFNATAVYYASRTVSAGA
ncbi:CPBP family intramembrane glutamic endopeptidase [Paenibacillus donghaensis]|uniref:CAAX prenyl protease 2/Lysostaphin resistance protein A-like domain-containing protein n=1 Tax=Paenibacillus donghaensis TaxID=414771 RepID=A0A2Z2K5A0_9BACL|nr:CPBP family intramembrane glutamic endopeptidase [Paenibacillus donghaensis]ASA19717.1 hypothetical protein B9T62_02150 [Paenibacillus donghaensis]